MPTDEELKRGLEEALRSMGIEGKVVFDINQLPQAIEEQDDELRQAYNRPPKDPRLQRIWELFLEVLKDGVMSNPTKVVPKDDKVGIALMTCLGMCKLVIDSARHGNCLSAMAMAFLKHVMEENDDRQRLTNAAEKMLGKPDELSAEDWLRELKLS